MPTTHRLHAPALTLALGLAAALIARPLSACSIVGPSVLRGPVQTLLMVVPAAESVYVGRAGRLERVALRAWLRPRDFVRRGGAWQRVYGQRVRILRAGWSVPAGLGEHLRSGRGEAVVVSWGSGANCGPTAWRQPALSMRPGARAVLMATLRPRRQSIAGVPTFDAYGAARGPYPVDRGWAYMAAYEKARGRWLNVEEYWSMAETFPAYGRNGPDLRSFDRWLARNPALARLFPAPLFLRSAQTYREEDTRARRGPGGAGARGPALPLRAGSRGSGEWRRRYAVARRARRR